MFEDFDQLFFTAQYHNDINFVLDDQTKLKIANYYQRHYAFLRAQGFRTVDKFIAYVDCNPMQQIHFSMQAKKQNLVEAFVLEKYLMKIPGYLFGQLDAQGGNSISFGGNTKTLDFIGHSSGSKRPKVVAHKFTDGAGGAQDLTLIELRALYQQWKNSPNWMAYDLVLLVDGTFWMTKNGSQFMEELHNPDERIIVCHSKDLHKFL